jgi:hypothetical protein
MWLLLIFSLPRCMLWESLFCPPKIGKLAPRQANSNCSMQKKREGLDRCSWFNYRLPIVTGIFLFGLVRFRLTDYDPFVSVPIISSFPSDLKIWKWKRERCFSDRSRPFSPLATYGPGKLEPGYFYPHCILYWGFVLLNPNYAAFLHA